MNFEDLVKAWVLYDNKIRESNKELKILREKRTITDSKIIQHIENNNLENATIKIDDSHLKFIKAHKYQAITYSHLKKCFLKYFNDEEKAQDLLELIKNTRIDKVETEIRRFYNK